MTDSKRDIILQKKTNISEKRYECVPLFDFYKGDKMPSYKTIKLKTQDEFVEKRSRFIGNICPTKTVDEANAFIAEIKSKNYNATHNVWAYILRDGNIKRYSDDGEPQGTAGIPTLDVLEKEGICDVTVVTTRYFGGTLLGTGGLVRAYSHSAKIAVDAGKIIEMTLCSKLLIHCDYNFYGKLNSLIPEMGGIIDNAEFTDEIILSFHIKSEDENQLSEKIIDLSNGNFHTENIGFEYF
ncbi:MAG: YigZ family protein [Oscillospiraceae bacterium]